MSRMIRRELREYVLSAGPLKVDRDKGVIYGVKVLGWDSDNKRRYVPEAGRQAIGLYEGIKVFTDHPVPGHKHARNDRDAFGKLFAVRWEPDGVYADLHYFKTHPLAQTVCEDVERGLGVFGLSHNANGEGETRDGTFWVHKILEVRSVDLVSEAATVTNLWESKMKNYKDAVLAIDDKTYAKVKAVLLEVADEYADMPTMPDETDWRSHCSAAIGAILKDEQLSPEEMKTKIDSILDAAIHDSSPAEECKEDDEKPAKKDGEGEGAADEKKKAEESKKQKPATGKQLQEHCQRLCKLANVTWDKPLQQTYEKIGDENAFLDLLESIQTRVVRRGTPPRSSAAGVPDKKADMDAKSFAKAVR